MKTLQIPAVIIFFVCALFMVYPPFGGSGKAGSSPGPRLKFPEKLDTPLYAVVEQRIDKKTAELARLNAQNLLYSKAISKSVDSLQKGLKVAATLDISQERLNLLDTLPIHQIKLVKN